LSFASNSPSGDPVPFAPAQPQTVSAEALDRLPGRYDCVPSAISGHLLRYYTPDPLTELLDRLPAATLAPDPALADPWLALALLPAAARRSSTRALDIAEAGRLLAMLSGPAPDTAPPALIAMGECIDTRHRGLREEMVFVGGTSGATAEHLFAPDARLPALIESLSAALRAASGGRPAAECALTGFFCVHAHPFLDGNGRWARVQVVGKGMRVAAPVSGVIAAIQLSDCADDLVARTWPTARARGLRDLVARAERFEQLVVTGVADVATTIAALRDALLQRTSRPDAWRVLSALLLDGQLSADRLQQMLGLSRKAASGRLDALRDAGAEHVHFDAGVLSARPLLDAIDRVVADARARTFPAATLNEISTHENRDTR
jgi:hypothetical protein